MDKKFNIIYGALALLVLIVLIQSYVIYDFKNSLTQTNQVEDTTSSSTITLKDYNPRSVDPFDQMKKIQEQMQKNFGQFNSIFANDPFFQDAFKDMGISPLSDLHDDGDKYVIDIDIPGVAQNNINIKTENNRITISANTQSSNDTNNTNYIHKERFSQRFERIFSVPLDADMAKMNNSYENDVLKIVIPKE